jgi:hypothetical protein
MVHQGSRHLRLLLLLLLCWAPMVLLEFLLNGGW